MCTQLAVPDCPLGSAQVLRHCFIFGHHSPAASKSVREFSSRTSFIFFCLGPAGTCRPSPDPRRRRGRPGNASRGRGAKYLTFQHSKVKLAS